MVGLLAASTPFFSATGLAAESGTDEYRVKAAFLFHFAQFVDWPAETFKAAGSPVIFCTMGEDPFDGVLDNVVSGKLIGNRPVQVQHFKQPQGIQNCHVLFVGSQEKNRVVAILESVKQSAVLTVGESDHFAQQGGMIGFLMEEGKLRFEINLDATQGARLTISARLLSLAKAVIGSARGK